MTVRDNNIYQNGRVIDFGEGEQMLIRSKVALEGSITDIYHTLKRGERLDQVAYKYYSNFVEDSSKYWWLIADVNNIHNPLDISDLVGTSLLIPNLTKAVLQI